MACPFPHMCVGLTRACVHVLARAPAAGKQALHAHATWPCAPNRHPLSPGGTVSCPQHIARHAAIRQAPHTERRQSPLLTRCLHDDALHAQQELPERDGAILGPVQLQGKGAGGGGWGGAGGLGGRTTDEVCRSTRSMTRRKKIINPAQPTTRPPRTSCRCCSDAARSAGPAWMAVTLTEASGTVT